MSNPYIPYPAVIKDLCQETEGERAIKTFTVDFADKKVWKAFICGYQIKRPIRTVFENIIEGFIE